MTPFYPLESTPGFDPAPNVPTPEEIRKAEDLLHRLETELLPPDGDGDTADPGPGHAPRSAS